MGFVVVVAYHVWHERLCRREDLRQPGVNDERADDTVQPYNRVEIPHSLDERDRVVDAVAEAGHEGANRDA